MEACFHCGLPPDPKFAKTLDGQDRSFCCIGCSLAAEAIIAGGLSNFYQYRDTLNTRPDSGRTDFTSYDLDSVQQEFVSRLDALPSEDSTLPTADICQARISIGGISCAACAWLIEHYLLQNDAVEKVAVNVSSHLCIVTWDRKGLPVSALFSLLHEIGYQPVPAIKSELDQERKRLQRNALLRLGVAGLGMMQVGMVAIALHAGAAQDMGDFWQQLFRWTSFVVATPVILYSARPFFVSAWRALSFKTLNMDVSVSLALILAYGASAWATLSGGGEVYFDSVSMFTFFLLVGRYLEMQARNKNAQQNEKLSHLLPLTVERLLNEKNQNQQVSGFDEKEVVPLNACVVGDRLAIAAGAVFPVDGIVIDGETSADESLLSGESLPKPKQVGDTVYAGSINGESGVAIKVLCGGDNTRLSAIEKLVDVAAELKPRQVALADHLAAKFVAAVIVVSVGVFAVWMSIAPERAFWVALSVLVVTCPCALSLATPTALTAGVVRLRQRGILVNTTEFMETLNDITHVVLDKTGTLTTGESTVAEVLVLDSDKHNGNHRGVSENGDVHNHGRREAYLSIIAALEEKSAHPIAKAFESFAQHRGVERVLVHPGHGVQGVLGDDVYRFGTKQYALNHENLPENDDTEIVYPGNGLWLLLSCNQQALAWVRVDDQVREGIAEVQGYFNKRHISVEILSGDRQENVRSFAEAHGFQTYRAGVLPEGKLAHIQALQAEGAKVLMVGDGINDVAVLKGADASIAVGSATRLVQTKASSIMLRDNLNGIISAFEAAKTVKSTIRQNIMWALLYNGVALPAAVMGLIPPYLAAIGMSLSSLVVVLNSLRYSRDSARRQKPSLNNDKSLDLLRGV